MLKFAPALLLLMLFGFLSKLSSEEPRIFFNEDPPTPNQSQAKNFDWPQWRGLDRNARSKETGLLREWPKSGPTLIWKKANLGGGYSSPSISRQLIIGLSYRTKAKKKADSSEIPDDPIFEGEQEVVWALDEKTGKEIWVSCIGPRGKAAYNDGPRSTPTIDENRIYVLGISGDLVCLELCSGKLLWRKSLVKDFDGKMMSNWGFSESPLIDGKKVVVTPGSDKAALIALDKETGKVIWKAHIPDCGGAGYSSIMKMTLGDTPLYVTWLGIQLDAQGKIKSGKGLVAVHANSGKLLWKYDRIANRTANIPTVIIQDNLVFCSNGYPQGGTAVLECSKKKEDVTIKELAYQPAKVLQNHHGGMVADGEFVYMGCGHRSGLPTCVQLRTAKILWKEDPPLGLGSANVIYADGMLYFAYEDGTIALIQATPKRFHCVSRFTPEGLSGKPTWAHLIIANGKLYFRDQDRLYCFDIKAKPEKNSSPK